MIVKRLRVPDLLNTDAGSKRSGRHLSDVIAYLLRTINPEVYGDREITPDVVRLWSLGLRWEEAIADAIARTNPTKGGKAQHRIKVDGIRMTPDWVVPRRRRVREFKFTRIHIRNPIESPRFWHYRVQLMAYLYGMCRVTGELWDTGELWVYFACGYGAGGVEKPRAWKLVYSLRELKENWRMILNASKEMDQEAA